MDDIMGIAVVFIIISGLTFALVKQIKETKSSGNFVSSPLFRKQLNRKNIIKTVTLFGILLFFTLNIVSGLNIVSSISLSNGFTALGTFVSFSIYLYAKFAMTQKQENQCENLYN